MCLYGRPGNEQYLDGLAHDMMDSFAARGTNTRVDTGLYQYVYVDIGITLAAAVTRQSMERLHFVIGDEVTMTFKATAVQVFV